MKEYFKNNFARIFYDDALDTLYLQYTSKVPSDEQFILVNQEAIKVFTQLQTTKFVADIRKMGIISINSQAWVVKNMLPGLLAHLKGKKLHHAQLLDPNEIMSKVSASNIKNKSSQVAEGFEVVQFTSEDEMIKYLKSVK
ncbi:MAG TPA: hypothetical protein VIT44_10555 [Cyclobacteriaceae bacterium]